MNMIGFLDSMETDDPGLFSECLAICPDDVHCPPDEVLREFVATYLAVLGLVAKPAGGLDIFDARARSIDRLNKKASRRVCG